MPYIYRGRTGGTSTAGTSTATTSSTGIIIWQVPPEVRDAGAEPAGWFTPDMVPYLGRNTGFYAPRYVNGASGNNTINLPPIPLEWIVSPQNITSSKECPTAEGTIQAFVAANLIGALILIVTAFRPFIYRSTLHVFGRRGGRNVYWTWVFKFGWQLLGNLAASLVIINTPGYGHLELDKIFALYASRPSLKPWWLAILRTVVTVDGHRFPDGDKRLMAEKADMERINTTSGSSNLHVPNTDKPEQEYYKSPHDTNRMKYKQVEHPYVDSYISAVLVEILLQTVAAIFIGITWDRFPNAVIKDFMGPSLRYMFVAPALTLLAAVAGVPIWRLDGEAWSGREKKDTDPQTGKVVRKWTPTAGMKRVRVSHALWGSLFFIPAYTAAWVYWTYFLTLPGALWCPPNLVSQAAIWTLTTIF